MRFDAELSETLQILENRLSFIDVGFRELAKIVPDLTESSLSKATEVLLKYRKKYANYINRELIKPHGGWQSLPKGLKLPLCNECFIPQNFMTAISVGGTASGIVWEKEDIKKDIGHSMISLLHHPSLIPPVLILGHPGSGKTLLCHMLAAQVLSHDYHVIIINLRDTNATDSIDNQINSQIERDRVGACTWNDIRKAVMTSDNNKVNRNFFFIFSIIKSISNHHLTTIYNIDATLKRFCFTV